MLGRSDAGREGKREGGRKCRAKDAGRETDVGGGRKEREEEEEEEVVFYLCGEVQMGRKKCYYSLCGTRSLLLSFTLPFFLSFFLSLISKFVLLVPSHVLHCSTCTVPLPLALSLFHSCLYSTCTAIIPLKLSFFHFHYRCSTYTSLPLLLVFHLPLFHPCCMPLTVVLQEWV